MSSNIRESILIQLHHSRVRDLLVEVLECKTIGAAWGSAEKALENLDEFAKGIAAKLEEETYSKDLAIKHFPVKWDVAKVHACERLQTQEGIEYWLLVRRFYLELGGEYIEQLNAKEKAEYAANQ